MHLRLVPADAATERALHLALWKSSTPAFSAVGELLVVKESSVSFSSASSRSPWHDSKTLVMICNHEHRQELMSFTFKASNRHRAAQKFSQLSLARFLPVAFQMPTSVRHTRTFSSISGNRFCSLCRTDQSWLAVSKESAPKLQRCRLPDGLYSSNSALRRPRFARQRCGDGGAKEVISK